VTTVAAEGGADFLPEPAALEVPDDRSETVEGMESQADTVPEDAHVATTAVGAEPGAALTVDDLAVRISSGELDLPTSPEGLGCAEDAERLLGPDVVPLALPIMVDDVAGIGYVAADVSAAAVFDPDGCGRLALLP
jgi:hypothetical protein